MKHPKHPTKKYPADEISKAFDYALGVAQLVSKDVFFALLNGNLFGTGRYILSTRWDASTRGYVAHVQPLEFDEFCTSVERFTQMIGAPGFTLSNEKLANLSEACTQEITRRSMRR